MRLAVVATVLLSALAAALAPGRARAAALPVHARIANCHSALGAFDRSFDTNASMRRIAGARRMAIRFDVQVRRPWRAHYHRVPGAGFGTWFRSDPGVGTYRYSRTTNGLSAPAYYRMRVGFRWYGRGGKVLKTVYRRTGACHQLDMRPDLVVRRAVYGALGHRYAVRVFNRGRTATTAPFGVQLAFADGSVREKTVKAPLAPGTGATRYFPASACAAATAVVDPGDAVSESSETNNQRTVDCP